MGACCQAPVSEEEKKKYSQIKNKPVVANPYEEKPPKILMLGPGGCGKTTIFRQLQMIYGLGYNEYTRRGFITDIHLQLVETMQILVAKCEESMEEDGSGNGNGNGNSSTYPGQQRFDLYSPSPANHDSDSIHNGNNSKNSNHNSKTRKTKKKTKTKTKTSTTYSKSYCKKIKKAVVHVLDMNKSAYNKKYMSDLQLLWNNAAIQDVVQLRHELSIPDSCHYFFDEIERISADEYLPTDADILSVRIRTTGVHEVSFDISGLPLNICDVGGQMSERKKWINAYNHVTIVCFVISLSCYNEVMYELEQDSMVDTIKLFVSILEMEWFTDTPFILFFNKYDLFIDKIQNKQIPISNCVCFQNYDGPETDVDASLQFIMQQFRDCNKMEDRQLSVHYGNSLDKIFLQTLWSDIAQVTKTVRNCRDIDELL